MLYDRPYRRYKGASRRFPVLKWILIINFGLFVIQSVFRWWFNSDFPERYFGLNSSNLLHGFIWTPLTYSLLHDTVGSFPWHLIFNMLAIFIFGRIVEQDIGPHKLLDLYILSAFTGGLIWVICNFQSQYPLIGASAAAMGLLTVYCIMHADERVTFLLFFIIPVMIKPRYLGWGIFGIELFGFLFSEMIPGSMNRIAHSAHIGGMLGGLFYFRFLINRESIIKQGKTSVELPFWLKKKSSSRSSKRNFKINIGNRRDVQNEVDRILDKINSHGFGALSEEEKQTLDRAKDILSR